MSLSEFIKQKRLGVFLTQQEAVKLLGYKNSQFLSSLEVGKRKPPIEVLKRMCEVYRISQDEMRSRYVQQAKVDAEVMAIKRWDEHFATKEST
ncbi:MAG TPA: helix-turn-helix transcriptional regulator [Bdellovibrio sp.]|uniref:helix-turn-helix domain-containing protein n=1 Tax=Bdellovibrio sp. TaxID=28201 RepID=UPI002F1EC752